MGKKKRWSAVTLSSREIRIYECGCVWRRHPRVAFDVFPLFRHSPILSNSNFYRKEEAAESTGMMEEGKDTPTIISSSSTIFLRSSYLLLFPSLVAESAKILTFSSSTSLLHDATAIGGVAPVGVGNCFLRLLTFLAMVKGGGGRRGVSAYGAVPYITDFFFFLQKKNNNNDNNGKLPWLPYLVPLTIVKEDDAYVPSPQVFSFSPVE